MKRYGVSLPPPIVVDGLVGDRIDYLATQAKDRRVLHIGCADRAALEATDPWTAHLHLRLARTTSALWGIDLDSSAMGILRNKYGLTNLVVMDAYKLDSLELPGPFDLLIIGELIEHVMNPGHLLRKLQGHMSIESLLLITTPNALSLKTACWGVFGRENANEEHVSMFHPSGLRLLLLRAGWELVRIYGATYDWWSRRRLIRNRMANRILRRYLRTRPWHADCLVGTASQLKSLAEVTD